MTKTVDFAYPKEKIMGMLRRIECRETFPVKPLWAKILDSKKDRISMKFVDSSGV